MTDAASPEPKLYAAREPVFPRRVSGRFRTLKWWIMGVTLAIYYLTPWLRWDRGADLPDQAVLVDLAGRRFYFFFIEIWPHEFYFVAGLLIMAGLGLFLFTAALGRVWCGYACPQTVWTDLFMTVERWIEGDRNARVRLWSAPWSLRKLRLRAAKYAIWLLIAVATGGAWIFYFADAPTLLADLLTGDAAFVAYASLGLLTATTFLFGGFAREQICLYACPWPRIQAAMTDESTLTVSYRDWRGEPRGKHRKAAGAAALGDCIDCSACVNVCPTGVDIRDGQQMGCITCALCIDACDEVMARTGRPRGLIDYITLADAERERSGETPAPIWRRVLRPRLALYFVLWAGIGLALISALAVRTDAALAIAPIRNPINVVLSDGSVRNAYEIRLRNMSGDARTFRLSAEAAAPLALDLEAVDGQAVTVAADSMLIQRLYLTASPSSPAATAERLELELAAVEAVTGARISEATIFHGRPR